MKMHSLLGLGIPFWSHRENRRISGKYRNYWLFSACLSGCRFIGVYPCFCPSKVSATTGDSLCTGATASFNNRSPAKVAVIYFDYGWQMQLSSHQRRMVIAIVASIFAVIFAGSLFLWIISPATPKTVPVKASQEVQNKRYALIQKVITDGFIHKVEKPSSEYPDLAYVYTLPPFQDLVYEEKKTVVIYCFAWAYEVPLNANGKIELGETDKSLILKDARSNKTIGSFTDTFGLSLK